MHDTRLFIPLFLVSISVGTIHCGLDDNQDVGQLDYRGCFESEDSVSIPIPGGYEGWCNPGGGVMTGIWAGENWQGPATARWGEPGEYFSVEWTNKQESWDRSHQEFDFSQKRNYHKGKDQGYGVVPLRDAMNRDLTMTQNGAWEIAPVGKTHINVIIWLNKNQGTESKANGASIDVTISEWFHEKGKEKYRNGQLPKNAWFVGEGYQEGSNYRFYKRDGDLGERASYIIVRDQNRQSGSVNPSFFIRKLIEFEKRDNSYTFDENWFVSSMGWEVTGQSAGFDKDIGNSSGKYTFNCFSIPSLNGNDVGAAYKRCDGSQSPNPTEGSGLATLDSPRELRGKAYSETAGEITWKWGDNNPNGTQFEIKRNGQVLGTTQGGSYYDGNLQAGQNYRYEVISRHDSYQSSQAAATTIQSPGGSGEPPAPSPTPSPPPSQQGSASAPNNLRGDVYSSRRLEIFWNRSANAVKYEVWRGSSHLATIDGTSYQDRNIESNRSYSYRVYAIDSNGKKSSASNTWTSP